MSRGMVGVAAETMGERGWHKSTEQLFLVTFICFRFPSQKSLSTKMGSTTDTVRRMWGVGQIGLLHV